jgi:large subunit ribosomal protein L24
MIRKGDTVIVIRGDDKGKTGRVLSIDPAKKLAVVQRVRLITRHQKPGRKQAMKGGVIEKEAPIALSALALIDPKTGKATRVRTNMVSVDEAGDRQSARRSKSRASIKTDVEIERPTVKPRS